MRKIDDSGNAERRIRLSSCAEARSRPKGFSTIMRAPLAEPNGQLLHYCFEEEVELPDSARAFVLCRGRAQCDKRCVVGVVAIDVAEQGTELLPGGRIEAAVLFEGVFGAGFELVEIPAGLGYADHWNIESSALDHRLRRAGRSSCRRGHRWRRRRQTHRSAVDPLSSSPFSSLQTILWLVFQDGRRTRSASPIEACRRSLPLRAN